MGISLIVSQCQQNVHSFLLYWWINCGEKKNFAIGMAKIGFGDTGNFQQHRRKLFYLFRCIFDMLPVGKRHGSSWTKSENGRRKKHQMENPCENSTSLMNSVDRWCVGRYTLISREIYFSIRLSRAFEFSHTQYFHGHIILFIYFSSRIFYSILVLRLAAAEIVWEKKNVFIKTWVNDEIQLMNEKHCVVWKGMKEKKVTWMLQSNGGGD